MSAASAPVEPVRRRPSPNRASRPRAAHAGWRVIAAKEFGDHLLSVRFIVLLVVLGLAAAIPLYFAADLIRAAAPAGQRRPGRLPACSRSAPQDYSYPARRLVRRRSWRRCSGSPSPSTRSTASAPRGRCRGSLAQPIYRDDVINGKFAAGLAVIGLVLLAVIGVIAGFGISGSGSCPHVRGDRPARGWVLVTFLYVGAVAGVRAAAVGRRPAGGDVGADRLRRLARC